MPGTNAGTGRPISFRCSQCRRIEGATGPRTARGWIDRVELTGRTRKTKPGTAGSRNSLHRREYRCLDCGHVGWSRHIDLEYKEQR